MAANRANLFSNCQKVVKKHYESSGADKRTLLEQLVFAALLEDCPAKIAEDCYAHLENDFFDWNEVRVSGIPELVEKFAKHPQAERAAMRAKTVMQNVFEAIYSFDLETLKKGNQGKAIAEVAKYGATPFMVGYVTQHALGGHSIPTDRSLIGLMLVLGVINEKEAEAGNIPGMERAIPKTKGVEFAGMIHELAVDYQITPFSKKIRDVILSIAPDAKTRFPKRKADEPEPTASKKPTTKKKTAKKPAEPATKKTTTKKKAVVKKETPKKAPAKKTTKKSTTSAKKTTTKKKAATKKTSSRISKKKPK